MNKVLWGNKSFDFNYPAEKYLEFIRRLRSTHKRLADIVENLSEQLLKFKEENSWSIQENAGHLITADYLFNRRLDDYDKGLDKLTAALMDGKKTFDADYNQSDIDTILIDFKTSRDAFLFRLEKYDLDDYKKKAFHPRLKVDMRLCDMLLFMADHDDYHLDKIKAMIEQYSEKEA